MWTETYAQIMDRAIIERIKEREFARDGQPEKAATAGRQAEELEAAAREYIRQVEDGAINHIPHEHLRFHDHGVEVKLPNDVAGCLDELRRVHEFYWETQTKINALKPGFPFHGAGRQYHAQRLAEFFELQLIIDDCNQRRNEVRSHCDILFTSEHDAS